MDARLALSPDATPFTTIVGDRVVAFEQFADGRDAASVVKTYRVEDTGCDWVPAR